MNVHKMLEGTLAARQQETGLAVHMRLTLALSGRDARNGQVFRGLHSCGTSNAFKMIFYRLGHCLDDHFSRMLSLPTTANNHANKTHFYLVSHLKLHRAMKTRVKVK